LQPLINPRHFR